MKIGNRVLPAVLTDTQKGGDSHQPCKIDPLIQKKTITARRSKEVQKSELQFIKKK